MSHPSNAPSPPRVAVVVQSRMGSSRYPGKMMADLAGRPLIDHILERAQAVRSAGSVMLATTDHPRDDVLAARALALGVAVVRGPEDDVMQRFLLALEQHPAEYVARVCGDSPLFEPAFLDRCAAALIAADGDVALLRGRPASALQGAEVVSARALRRSHELAPDDPLVREHVTAFALRHAGEHFRVVELEPDPAYLGDFDLSVDTPADLERLRAIYACCYRPGSIVDLREVVAEIGAGRLPAR
ncbi:MAG: NTP transferase domain-containing protein [Candidatus Krumholzibacteriia bacterium]